MRLEPENKKYNLVIASEDYYQELLLYLIKAIKDESRDYKVKISDSGEATLTDSSGTEIKLIKSAFVRGTKLLVIRGIDKVPGVLGGSYSEITVGDLLWK